MGRSTEYSTCMGQTGVIKRTTGQRRFYLTLKQVILEIGEQQCAPMIVILIMNWILAGVY